MVLARPFSQDKYDWHAGGPRFWSVTGEKLGPLTMRRLVNSQWQYRNMTDEEAEQHQLTLAW